MTGQGAQYFFFTLLKSGLYYPYTGGAGVGHSAAKHVDKYVNKLFVTGANILINCS